MLLKFPPRLPTFGRHRASAAVRHPASLVLWHVVTRRSGALEVTMNEDTLRGQWTQLKGKVREQWGKLTDDDLDQIQGKSEQLVGRLQERYGWARDDAKREVDNWLSGARPAGSM